MYNSTSAAFETQVKKTSRTFKARVTVDGVALSNEIRSFMVTTGSCGPDTFTFGNVFASYVDIVMAATDMELAGKELFVETGLKLPGGTIEYIPMGYFTINPADMTKTRDQITLKATDRISAKCDGVYIPTVTFPATIQEVLNDIVKQTGVTIETLMATTGIIQESMKGLMFREVFGYIAGLLGGFCWCDRNGKIKISAYPKTTVRDVAADIVLDIQSAQEAYTVDTIVVKVSEDGVDTNGNDVHGVSYVAGTGNGNQVIVSNPYMTQTLFNAMKERVLNYSYCPGTVEFLGDPRLEPADSIKVFNYDGRTFVVPCMNLVHDFDGGLITTVVAPGQAVSDSAVQGPLTQQVARLSTEVVLAKQVIATKVSAKEVAAEYATIDRANILEANIATLTGDFASFKTIVTDNFTATNAEITNIKGDYAEFKTIVTDNFTATNAEIENLSGDFLKFKTGEFEELSAKLANFENVTTTDFTAVNAEIANIKANQITTEYLTANFAQIDLANINVGAIKTAMIDTGAVKTAQIADGSITDAKIVELTANKITAGTLSVERLEIRGSENSIVYELNNITGALQAQNVDTLNGEILTPRTITADKIVANTITAEEIAAKSITANEIAVNTITAAEIRAQTITTQNLALDAIKSINYVAGVSGSYLNLADGSFDSKNTKWDSDGLMTVQNIDIQSGKMSLYATGDSDSATFSVQSAINSEKEVTKAFINGNELIFSKSEHVGEGVPGSTDVVYNKFGVNGINLKFKGINQATSDFCVKASGIETTLTMSTSDIITKGTLCIDCADGVRSIRFRNLKGKIDGVQIYGRDSSSSNSDVFGLYDLTYGQNIFCIDGNSNFYFNYTLHCNTPTYLKKGVTVTGGVTTTYAIELKGMSTSAGYGGYIDFHYNNSSKDYTSRFIESTSGQIEVFGKLYAELISKSDRKVKENVHAICSAKAFIMALNPVAYTYTDDTRIHMGLIAQEVAEAAKRYRMGDLSLYQAICFDVAGNYIPFQEGLPDSQMKWGLAYTELIAPMIVVIQEQQREFAKLQAIIEELKGTIAIVRAQTDVLMRK